MSDLATLDYETEVLPHLATSTPRVDVFALTRALVFTKDTYRTLRAKVTQARERPPVDEHAVVQAAQAALASLPIPERALTPWDLIDEEPSAAGVEFTNFQQRARDLQRELAA